MEYEFHPVASLFPLMSESEINSLAEDIADKGQRDPIMLHPDGRIVDGRNRYLACQRANVEPISQKWQGGEGDLVPYVVSLNLHRRHLNESQRAMVAAKLANIQNGRPSKTAPIGAVSKTEAAQLLNVGTKSVERARKVQNGTPELTQAVEQGRVAVSVAADIAEEDEETQRRIAGLEEKAILAAAKEIRERRTQQGLNALQSSECNEWYTPSQYIEAAREVMGGIDFDPASCEFANKTVKADQYCTAEDDGLSIEWGGRVWLNPPYGKNAASESNQGVWSTRLIEQHKEGCVDEAVLLVNAVTDRAWFKALWQFPICFVDSRIKFISPDSKKAQPTHGNVLVYLGPNVKIFTERFSAFGRVVVPRGWFSEVA